MPDPSPPDPDWLLHALWLCRQIEALDVSALAPPMVADEAEHLGLDLKWRARLKHNGLPSPLAQLTAVMSRFIDQRGLRKADWKSQPQSHRLPMLGVSATHGLCLAETQSNDQGEWVLRTPQGQLLLQRLDKSWAFTPFLKRNESLGHGMSKHWAQAAHSVKTVPALALHWLQSRSNRHSISPCPPALRLQDKTCVQVAALQTNAVLQIKALSFTYRGQVHDLSIDHWLAKLGERIGMIGDVGAGKSTLLKLMAGLRQPCHGHVRLGNVDMYRLIASHSKSLIGYLPQTVQLFNGTLRDNLLAGQTQVTDAELLRWCLRVGLMPLVNSHASGLNMPIQEGPQGTSAGQRQLIGLVRLLIQQPVIWLLDDPLAHLPHLLHQRVADTLAEVIRAEHTLIFVSCAPEMLALARRLMVVRAGRLIKDGPRDAILTHWRKRLMHPSDH